MVGKRFWMVMREDTTGFNFDIGLHKKHYVKKEAVDEAHRLAGLSHEAMFYIMEATEAYRTATPPIERIGLITDIPGLTSVRNGDN